MARQQRVWLEIAELALRRWSLPPAELSVLGSNGKAVLKVQADAGLYVLRLYKPGGVTEAALRSELNWLSTIHRHTDLLAPRPIHSFVDGCERSYIDIHCGQLPAPHKARAVLFQFIDGESKTARDLTLKDVQRIGEYLGKLHREGQRDLPAGFGRTRLDWNGLFGDDSPYASPQERDQLSAAQRAVYAEVANRLRQRLSALASEPNSMGLIHADLLAKNIVFVEDAIAALDFEYCAWGFFLYDLAPLLWQLKGDRAADYPELQDALWRGYTSIRPQVEGQRDLLESMTAARQLVSCRWLLANLTNPTVSAAAPALIAERFAELRGFIDTGRLQRQSRTL
ncbi:MAG: phosphotransferase [Chloroflexi bacterium]|nr:phosphotransferase [Chloroflexota bacterium]